MFRGPEVFFENYDWSNLQHGFLFPDKKKADRELALFSQLEFFSSRFSWSFHMRLRSEDRIALKTTILGQKGHFLSRDHKFTFDSLEEVEIVQRQWVKILYQTVRKRCLLYCLTRLGRRCRRVHHNYVIIKAKNDVILSAVGPLCNLKSHQKLEREFSTSTV